MDHEALKQQFQDAGIAVEVQEKLNHWKLNYNTIIINYWPNTGTCYVFGRSFKPSTEALIGAIVGGRIAPPPEADAGQCKRCDAEILWLKNPKTGKPLPCDLSGENHFSTCPAAESFRSAS